MSEEEKGGLVPRLRFPGFNDIWESKRIEEIAPLQRGIDLPSEQIENGNVPVVYSNGIQKFHNKSVTKAPGIVTGRSGTIGKIHFIENGDYWPHNTTLWVTDFKGNIPKFTYYFFESLNIKRFASGSGVPTLNRNDVHAFLGCLPPSLPEQQKIADCLSSLDDLIAAQSQKLELLKTHKKALLQQLFPNVRGEVNPRLRFPEFRVLRPWEVRKISDLMNREINPVNIDLNETYWEIGIRSHGKGIFHKPPVTGAALGNKRVFWVDSHLFILNIIFAWEQAVAVTENSDKGMIASHRFPMYKAISGISDVIFIKYFFLTPAGKYLLGLASPGGAGRNKTLGRKEFEKIKIPCPDKTHEQQKIANCLSSLDELIETQSQKLKHYQTHKKSLMQQLFPTLQK